MSNFTFVVADTLPGPITLENNRELLDMEDHYINLLKPEYNIAQQAGNTLGVKHTETTKAALKLLYSSERREQIGALNRGKFCLVVLLNEFGQQLLIVLQCPMIHVQRYLKMRLT